MWGLGLIRVWAFAGWEMGGVEGFAKERLVQGCLARIQHLRGEKTVGLRV